LWSGVIGWIGVEVLDVGVDGGADRVAPAVGAEGIDVFSFGEVDGLGHGLGEVGEGAGGAVVDETLGDGDEKAAEGGVEVAGREIFAREEVVDVAAEVFGGEGLGFFFGVEIAEVGMFGGAGSAAAATVGEGEGTEKCANVGASGHGSLQKRRI
jgi:hypothetical protein